VFEVVLEQAPQRHPRPLLFGPRLRPEVHPIEHELPQSQHRAANLLALPDVPLRSRPLHHVLHEQVNSRRPGLAEQRDFLLRQIVRRNNPRPHRVIDVVVDVSHPVDDAHHPPLERLGLPRPSVIEDPVQHLLGQIESPAIARQHLHHPQRVLVVPEPHPVLLQLLVEHLLPDVPEGRVTEVVPQPDRLGQVLVQPKRPRHRPRDEARLERVGKPGPVVVPFRRHEHLRLVLEPPERLGVNDPVPVALERRPHRAVLLRLPPPRRIRLGRQVPEVLRFPGSDPVFEGGGVRGHDPMFSPTPAQPPLSEAQRFEIGSIRWQRRR
jgi:hypothetical protein